MADATPLPFAIDAELIEFDSAAGRLACYVAGQGAPMLLLHSINAAGSAYEVRPIFEHYRQSRRVYALDLPGFGFSERSDRRYDIALYCAAVQAMAERIVADCGAPVDALALSLASEFLARAATTDPAAFRSLALITPTGFRASDARRRSETMASREIGWLAALLGVDAIGRRLFGALTRPAVIRYFLRRTWGSSDIDEGLADYDIVTAAQPGAHHAPLAFISGRLFSKDIRSVYERLAIPVLLAHGTRGDFKDFSGAGWLDDAEHWTQISFDTGALPHFEAPEALFAAYDRFLDRR